MYHKRHEQETAELLRCLSLYQCLTYGQIMRLLPELKEDILSGLLTRLEHQGRICYNRLTDTVTLYQDTVINPDTLAGIWIFSRRFLTILLAAIRSYSPFSQKMKYMK